MRSLTDSYSVRLRKNRLLHYEYEGKQWPAAWCHTYGIGRVVFLMPGHHEPSFLQPQLRLMITQAARVGGAGSGLRHFEMMGRRDAREREDTNC